MSLSKTARKGICKYLLALVASNALVMAASAQQWEYEEDFLTDTNKGAATTADWDTVNGVLELGVAQPLTAPAIVRSPMSDTGGEDLRDSRGIALGDLDGDGDLDAVVGNEGDAGGGARNIVYPNVDNGTGNRFSTAPVTIGNDTDLYQTLDIAVGDLDNDGDLDVVGGNFDGPGVYYLNDGSGTLDAGTLGSGTEFTASKRTWAIGLADFDNDGDLDYIEANSGSGGQDGQVNSLYLNRLLENNTLSFSSEIFLSTQGQRARSRALALGDIDNDGDIDVVFGEQPTTLHGGYNTCHTWGSSGFSSPVSIQPTSTFLTFAVKLADVNGDGYLDLIEGNQEAPTHVYMNNFPNSGVACDFSAPAVVGDSLAIDTTVALEVADFDMDGDLDIVEGNNGDRDDDGDETNDVPQPMRLFLNNGNGTFANGLDEVPPKQKVYGTDYGDIDGDGKLDLVSASSDEEQPAADPLPVVGGNAVYYNMGTPGGTPVQQLYSSAISIPDVGAIGRNMPTGALRFDPFPAAVHSSLTYHISNDNGSTWHRISPLRALDFPRVDTQLMWRVDMTTLSPVSASKPQVNLLTIADNRPPRFSEAGNDAGNPALIQAATGDPTFSVNMTSYFSDLEGHRMNFVGTSIPASLSLNPLSGVLSGTPTAADEAASPIDFQVEAFDGAESRVGYFRLIVGPDLGVPVITLNGSTPVTITVGDSFTDPGATANDAEDGDITANIVVGGDTVNTAVAGTYVITYNVTDSDGNAATEVTRTVNVVAAGTPTITLTGAATINLNVGDAFTDPGATASDPEDGDLTANIVVGGDTVNTAVAGTYVITYNVADSDGNAAPEVTRTVVVSSATGGSAPTITLNGSASVTITLGGSFSDPGATASDPEDGDITASIVVGGDTVDTGTAGTYVITYDVTDSDGNAAPTVTRTVTVTVGGIPTITLNGSATVSLTVGDSYTDAGATASDPEDGDITADIVVGGDTVDPDTAGTYEITYNVTDSDGNAAAEVTRTVTVSAPPPPAQCADGIDNDNDGRIDLADPGCTSATDNSEIDPSSGGGGGGGMTGAWELIGLMFASLIGLRRRRTGKIQG